MQKTWLVFGLWLVSTAAVATAPPPIQGPCRLQGTITAVQPATRNNPYFDLESGALVSNSSAYTAVELQVEKILSSSGKECARFYQPEQSTTLDACNTDIPGPGTHVTLTTQDWTGKGGTYPPQCIDRITLH